MLVCLSL